MARIRRLKDGHRTHAGRLLSMSPDSDGYVIAHLSKNGATKSFRRNRLVAIAFLENPLSHPEVNHRNNVRSDDRLSNLEWITQKQNQQIRRSMKLTASKAQEIRSMHSAGTSLKKLTHLFDVSKAQVGRVLRSENWA